MGHRSIVDKPSVYGAKGPGFNPQWRQEYISIVVSSIIFFLSRSRILEPITNDSAFYLCRHRYYYKE